MKSARPRRAAAAAERPNTGRFRSKATNCELSGRRPRMVSPPENFGCAERRQQHSQSAGLGPFGSVLLSLSRDSPASFSIGIPEARDNLRASTNRSTFHSLIHQYTDWRRTPHSLATALAPPASSTAAATMFGLVVLFPLGRLDVFLRPIVRKCRHRHSVTQPASHTWLSYILNKSFITTNLKSQANLTDTRPRFLYQHFMMLGLYVSYI
jgi:hypothetical protein